MARFYIGIDPGLTGGACVYDSISGEVVTSGAFDQGGKDFDLANLLVQFNFLDSFVEDDTCLAVLEKVSAMPGQGVSSMFKFGMIYGAIRMAIQAMGWPHVLVPPRTWTKVMHAYLPETKTTEDVTKLKPKEKSLIVAEWLFPNGHLKPFVFPGGQFAKNNKCRTPHSGIVDAHLLAYYGSLKHKGE